MSSLRSVRCRFAASTETAGNIRDTKTEKPRRQVLTSPGSIDYPVEQFRYATEITFRTSALPRTKFRARRNLTGRT